MDPARGLTNQGRDQIKTMGDFLVRQIGRVDLVIASPFVRALDTARGMASLLGCEVIETSPTLDPDGKPETAWSDVEALTTALCPDPDSAHVLVVTHHPLIGEIAELLCGVKTSDEKFHHGAVMHIHGANPLKWGVLEYFVPPKVVDRDEQAVVEAAAAVIAELTEDDEPEPTGLRHPKHADVLAPIRAKAERTMRHYFRRQKRLVLAAIKPTLAKLREADQPAKDATRSAIPDLLPITMTSGMNVDYSKALSAALAGGYEGLADELGSNSAMADDVVQDYLADHSLTKLTGGLDETTVDRLRAALADAYENGADFDGLVQAVKDEYSGFNDVRAGMIAQTEMNAAYNAGRKQLGLDMGFNQKAWDPDGMACAEICVPNVLMGWIGIEEEFESGDDAPPGHPNCDCSLSARSNPLAVEESFREGWVTIDGAHVFIDDTGTITKGPAALLGKSHKSVIAAKAVNAAGKAEQDVAEQTEHELSAALGMPKSPDNRPFDLQSKTVGVEIKTVITGKNDKITMSKDAIGRKHAEMKASKLKRAYTVVADKRGAKVKYLVRQGFGSFRLGSMTEVADTTALAKFMKLR